jgi:dTDP-4-amino-4,6-dideoxygalactose transaminase
MSPSKAGKYSYIIAESKRLLRQRTGRAHALLVGRGAAALWATLTALDLHDRLVLLPANTCYIVLWAVLQSGNQPHLVDIDPLTGNMSTATLDRSTVDRPAVVIPTHMYGLPAPMETICAWARARDVFVFEDAALALGTIVEGRPAGDWGNVSILSFGTGKIADADNGGALLTDDSALSREIERVLADLPLWNKTLERLNHQWLEIYWPLHQFESENPHLPDLYPALFRIYKPITRYRLPNAHWKKLRVELGNLDDNLAHRAEVARLYDEKLAADSLLRTLQRPEGAILWRYPLIVPNRDALLQALWGAGIFEATRWYPSLQTMRAALAPDLPAAETPAADQLAGEIVNLPLTDQADRAVEVILDFFGKN